MARVLIDGYNLLSCGGFENRGLLLSLLQSYRKEKGHEITIVFDGTRGGTGRGDHQFDGGIEVIFTPLTVTADDTIEELLEEDRYRQSIVVSSDRRIQSAARQAQTTFVTSDEFAAKLRASSRPAEKKEIPPWMEGRTEEPPVSRPSRKLSKKEKRRKRGLNDL